MSTLFHYLADSDVNPGNNLLSKILEACTKLRAYSLSQGYWSILVDSYGVIPDQANYHAQLRMLLQLRMSERSVDTLKLMDEKDGLVNSKSISLVMHACRRAGNVEDAFVALQFAKDRGIPIIGAILWPFLKTAQLTHDNAVYHKALGEVPRGYVLTDRDEDVAMIIRQMKKGGRN